jgi:CarboxypepD_reg-like domain/TonB-dependent Receptor Plug Domain
MKTKTLKLTMMIIGLVLFSIAVNAQGNGSLKGSLIDKDTKEAVPFADVWIEVGGNLQGCVTDGDGNFTLKPIPVGQHSVHFRSMGYQEVVITGINIDSDKITFLNDIEIVAGGKNLPILVITAADWDLFDPDNPSIKIMRSKQIEKLPESRNIPAMLAAMSSDIQVSDDNKSVYFRGSRKNDMAVYIDGIRIRGSEMNLPGMSIGSIMTYTGGVPAKYGDFTGGVVVIETKSYNDWLAEQQSRELMSK